MVWYDVVWYVCHACCVCHFCHIGHVWQGPKMVLYGFDGHQYEGVLHLKVHSTQWGYLKLGGILNHICEVMAGYMRIPS